MQAIAESFSPINKTEKKPVVIVGTGPVGVRLADELLNIDPSLPIVMYGNEPWEPYNRVGLTSFLAGEVSFDDIKNPVKAKHITSLVQHHNCAIEKIDRVNKLVLDSQGNQQAYSKLVLAIGSSPHRPNIPGTDLPHVYTFRDMDDVDQLFARRIRSRRTVVIGGGLLGLEAARAMQKHNTEVVIIEHSNRLMSRQLSDALSVKLLEEILALNIKLHLQTGVTKILGDVGVTGLELNNGKTLKCDTVILATGIVPNKKLAQDNGVIVGRGIRVNDTLQTSDPDIFAVGECCEHKGEIYGLVAPGFEQAAVSAQVINGKSAVYNGSINVSKLKVFGLSVYSIGETGDDAENISNQIVNYESSDGKSSFTLVVRHRRLVGAMGVGDWPDFERIQEAVRNKRRVWPWQLGSFAKKGYLWGEEFDLQVSAWPASAMVCNCKSITRGELTACISGGSKTLSYVQEKTGASTVCGSCKPLVASLLGDTAKLIPQVAYKTLAILSLLIAGFVVVHSILPAIPYSQSVQQFQLDMLWTDFLYKQISGYTLAGLTFIGVLLLSIRKRFNIKKLGDLSYWRITHVSLSLLALSVLVIHTGLNPGSNLNFLLLAFFVAVSAIGVASSLVNAFEHQLSPYRVKQWRTYSNRLHIVFSWPLPVLLGFHITSAYYF